MKVSAPSDPPGRYRSPFCTVAKIEGSNGLEEWYSQL